MKIIYFPIETLVRELPSRLLLAKEALSKNFDVIVIEHDFFERNIDNLKPGIVLYKDHGDWKAKNIFSKCKNNGFITAALDEEGFIYLNDRLYEDARIGKECIESLDMIFAWGNIQAKLLRKYTNKVFVTGNPRFDLHRLHYEGDKIDTTGSILFNMRFGLVNPLSGRNKEQVIEHLKNLHVIKNKQDEIEFGGFIEHGRIIFECFISLISKISINFPDNKIIIRPHPSEDHQIYRELSIKHKNIEVSSKDNLLEFDIDRADVIIHNGCTTGIEAIIRGKNVIVYDPIGKYQYDLGTADIVGKKIENDNEIIVLLDNIISNSVGEIEEEERNKYINIMKNHIYNIDGNYATTNIINKLDTYDITVDVKSKQLEFILKKISKQTNKQKLKRLITKYPSIMSPIFGKSKFKAMCVEDSVFPMLNKNKLDSICNKYDIIINHKIYGGKIIHFFERK